MSSFRPSARATDPSGRRWEIYAYKLQLPERQRPDPRIGPAVPSRFRVPHLLVRLLVDLPIAAARAARSDRCTIEAVSWAPYPIRYRWATSRELRGQVLASVEGQLARGETPKPRNARLILS